MIAKKVWDVTNIIVKMKSLGVFQFGKLAAGETVQ
jgi:hypothetical protein